MTNEANLTPGELTVLVALQEHETRCEADGTSCWPRRVDALTAVALAEKGLVLRAGAAYDGVLPVRLSPALRIHDGDGVRLVPWAAFCTAYADLTHIIVEARDLRPGQRMRIGYAHAPDTIIERVDWTA